MTATIDSSSPKTPTRSALGQSAGSAHIKRPIFLTEPPTGGGYKKVICSKCYKSISKKMYMNHSEWMLAVSNFTADHYDSCTTELKPNVSGHLPPPCGG
jgi:hypothetical protein